MTRLRTLAVEMLSRDDGLPRAETKRTILTMHGQGRAGIPLRVGVGTVLVVLRGVPAGLALN